ncbi:hypothetical protein OCA23_30320 [Bacillus cereus]|nr:hypothetical protein [Bacillus cereus]
MHIIQVLDGSMNVVNFHYSKGVPTFTQRKDILGRYEGRGAFTRVVEVDTQTELETKSYDEQKREEELQGLNQGGNQ